MQVFSVHARIQLLRSTPFKNNPTINLLVFNRNYKLYVVLEVIVKSQMRLVENIVRNGIEDLNQKSGELQIKQYAATYNMYSVVHSGIQCFLTPSQ